MYRCLACGQETEAAINSRNEKRCKFCYAVLSDAMLMPVVVVAVPLIVAAPPNPPVEQKQEPKPAIKRPAKRRKKA